jgi:hypothetical protein
MRTPPATACGLLSNQKANPMASALACGIAHQI